MTFFIGTSLHRPVGKILAPQSKASWMPSSQRTSFSPLDHGTETRWRISAHLHDGHPIWIGWFDDRDDFEAFVSAMLDGTLKSQRQLWDLPGKLSQPDFSHLLNWRRVPEGAWCPAIGGVTYKIAATVTVTGSPGSEQTITSNPTWNNSYNTVECIGSGGSGGVSWSSGTRKGTGGGGARYQKISNFAIASPGVTTMLVRVGNTRSAVTRTTSGNTNGNGTATDTTSYLKGSDNVTKVLEAQSGAAGQSGNFVAVSGGAAGAAGTGDSGNSGGRGGNAANVSVAMGTGGGSAGGPSGAGTNGGDQSTDGSSAGGTASGGTNAGAGGGGNRVSDGSSGTAPSGSNYGGGGGGASGNSNTITSGAGAQGVLWFTWTPFAFPNLPMLGM